MKIKNIYINQEYIYILFAVGSLVGRYYQLQ